MVWQTSQSPLYKAVESFNNSNRQIEPACDIPKAEPCAPKLERKNSEPCERATSEPCEPKCERPVSEPCGCKPKSAPQEYPHKPAQNGNFLQAMFGDKDMLLIAALIIILMHEKADMKIIIALGFILLM